MPNALYAPWSSMGVEVTAYVRPAANAAPRASGRIAISTVSPDLTTQGATSKLLRRRKAFVIGALLYRYGS